MIGNVNTRLLSYLQTALPEATIWAGVNYPPATYEPADGAGVAFRVRGGLDPEEEETPAAVLRPSIQFKVYAAAETDAWSAYMDLSEALTLPADSHVLAAVLDGGLGDQLKEPETGWDYVLAYYIVHIRNS